MSLVKPVRSRGESNVMWVSRRDSYKLLVIEQQIKQLQNDVKKLQGRKK